ncbi:2,3-bisphosphoglycerate-independent phosphoglycerate mutase [Flocculibacter collagenilyticus]|uniref:2,3-bisphosphoglycerate-independent phosphoglycerate mutase n=1 Tax=Flocculibacter collagenilyticus TaxID=2744479 RepID=UPI0018F67BA5|nr:2,3-bisphosphoglycerate-independent phosphoglycerate mutase [Flocculibacter collagenilyticus]
MSVSKKPLVLLILDGWGYREDASHNAIHHANTPVLDKLWQDCPHALISGSGMDVGLPDGQMGNSEVGHVNLGSGRIVYQDFTRISKAIDDGSFAQNTVSLATLDNLAKSGKALHLMGLLSPGGVHSHEDHIIAMMKLAKDRGVKQVYLHAFLDGRDTPPRSAKASLEKVHNCFEQLGNGRIASIVGRYYAMDRDQRWDRIEAAYNLMTLAEAEYKADNALNALSAAYERDENDEFVKATVIQATDQPSATIDDGDAVIFMNFRADRARQMTRTFVNTAFTEFNRKKAPALSQFVMLTEYADDIDAAIAYPSESLDNVLGDWLAKHNKTQLRISETEKYAHVTFFFSGGREEEFDGEQRILVPSPKVATYDLQPEMNAPLLTDKLVEAIKSQTFDVIICNYPNGDMVGHTGKFDAAVVACEAVDKSVGRVVEALKEHGGECIITADHGNAEQMLSETSGQAHTAHTSEPVPFIYVGRDAEVVQQVGKLSDIAPTMLHILDMEQPTEMTGQSMITLKQH